MAIPIGNIFGFSDAEDGNGVHVEVHENFINGTVDIHFENGVVINVANLKSDCPDHNCPHYQRDPDNFDPKFDSCDACQDDEYGPEF